MTSKSSCFASCVWPVDQNETEEVSVIAVTQKQFEHGMLIEAHV